MILPGGMEFLIILVIIIILFGAKKIPGLAEGIGNGVKEFRKGLKGSDKEKLKNTPNDRFLTTLRNYAGEYSKV